MYIHYNKNSAIDRIFMNIFWIELSISYIIKALKNSEIRENGIYKSGYFYKWSEIQSYNWIVPNTIQFKINTFFKNTRSIEFIIKEELKLKVDEVIQRKLPL